MTARLLHFALPALALAVLSCSDAGPARPDDTGGETAITDTARDGDSAPDAPIDAPPVEIDADSDAGDDGSGANDVIDDATDRAVADRAEDLPDHDAGAVDAQPDRDDADDISTTADVPDREADVLVDPPTADLSGDVGDPDVAVDLGEDIITTEDVVDPTDAGDLVDEEPESCAVLEPRIETRQREAAYCERSAECAVRDNPLCPLGGCFTYHAAGTDLTALVDDEAAYLEQDCSALQCACPARPPVPFCDGDSCGPCPINCPWTCDLGCDCVTDGCGCDLPLCVPDDAAGCVALAEALIEASTDLAGCQTDSDCIAVSSGVCDALPCPIALNREGGVEHLESLVEAYLSAGCEPPPSCECDTSPTPGCGEGRCQLP